MFEAKLSDSTTIKRVLDAIKDLIDQANFDCSADGLSLQAMDTPHVCLTTMTLRSQAFEVYRCDRPLSMGINLSSFSKILKCAGPKDSVKIVANDEGADCAEFIFENESADRIAHFELKLMDIDSEHLSIPEDSDYEAIISMPSQEYRRIFSDLSIIGDTITIEITKNTACFSVEGDIGNGSLNLAQSESADDKNAVTINVKEPVKMTFPGKYLNTFTKAVPISDFVTLCLTDGNPLAIEFSLPEEAGFVRYFLAPKIDQDAPAEEEEEEAEDEDNDEEE
eukprot:TRINITY_DN78693_c0_g1_i1.p1 TRINITY_DN78693_c0_g1~~TRINITY_DN78693_c0_g1_i1.p1  ORF type:complete len:280 (+),score=56.50 TRINITY_DN78693_c0_g1_i1:277-1116(+)